jgi:hypothetical protein
MGASVPMQAGTQFWDEKMEKELAEGHLSSTAFDRYINYLFCLNVDNWSTWTSFDFSKLAGTV